MSKRKTTGGPRAHRITEEDLKRRAEYKSRSERDRMWQRRAMYTIAALVGLSLILVFAGILNDQYLEPRQAITTVNGEEISTADFQARVRFLRWQTAQQLRDLYVLTGGNFNMLGEQGAQQINGMISELSNRTAFGSPVLDEMEEEILLQEEADRRDITVDQEEIDLRVDEFIAGNVGLTLPGADDATPTQTPTTSPTPLVSPTPTNTPTPGTAPELDDEGNPLPTATPELDDEGNPLPTATPTVTPTPTQTPTATATLSNAEIYATVDVEARDYIDDGTDAADVDREAIREVFYFDALREEVSKAIGAEVPTEELQVDVRHILLAFDPDNPSGQVPPTDEQKAAALVRAEDALAALQDGEPFALLAEALSDDSGSGSRGGELGWASPDTYVEAFRDTVETAELGEIVGPIETEFGYHIIQVNGREIRDLSPSELSNRQNQAFQTWLTEAKANADIERRDDWLDRIPGQPTYNELLGDILPLS